MNDTNFLNAIYDGAKEFYRKAEIGYADEYRYHKLYSYRTLVAVWDVVVEKLYIRKAKKWDSQTTLRHIKEFYRQRLGKNIKLTKKDLLELEEWDEIF